MLAAFTAEYASGEVRIDPDELAEARWFPLKELPPNLMPPNTLAWQVIQGAREQSG